MPLTNTLSRLEAHLQPTGSDLPLAAVFDEAAGAAVAVRRAAGEEIFGQGEAAGFVYLLVSGAARSCRVLADGRRQIGDFHLPGDVLGLEAEIEHRASAEAMTDTVLLAVRRTVLAAMAAQDGDLARQLWSLAVRGLQRSQEHASILGRLGATERVAAFLLAFARRLDVQSEMELPMTRQDIADYLGLTIHTVSRTLSQLQDSGVIDARASRRVRLRRQDDLAELCA